MRSNPVSMTQGHMPLSAAPAYFRELCPRGQQLLLQPLLHVHSLRRCLLLQLTRLQLRLCGPPAAPHIQ